MLLLLSGLLSGLVGCSGDDDEPLVECPSPSFLSGLITQVEAIQKEILLLEAQLPNSQGADRTALLNNINQAKEREESLKDELLNYRHCL
ncbi:hypothetical protein AHMF7616_02896 [Adhaeribacter pallidiroseus]|uniref:Uncharacterized protein n=2 Tax=Adhaeribacter pallidiroseus TaxID=2072847 RepID=A0A369QH82_9BACT|nr:hypothetical protein AHMF7616_02896 [Adhaeribacter pallidiroseus]